MIAILITKGDKNKIGMIMAWQATKEFQIEISKHLENILIYGERLSMILEKRCDCSNSNVFSHK